MTDWKRSGLRCPRMVAGVACLVLGAGLVGCKTRTSGIEGGAAAVHTEVPTVHLSKYVTVNNPKLAKTIKIVDLLTTTTESQLIRASVSIMSTSARTQQLLCRFSWFDVNGFEIDPGAKPWQPVLLYGNETKIVQDVAPSAAAQEFQIQVREN